MGYKLVCIANSLKIRLVNLAQRTGNWMAFSLGSIFVELTCNTAKFLSGMDKAGVAAYAGSGKVVEHVLDAKWLKRIAGVFALPGVEG